MFISAEDFHSDESTLGLIQEVDSDESEMPDSKKRKEKKIYKKSKAEVKNIQLTDRVLTSLTVESSPEKNSYLIS